MDSNIFTDKDITRINARDISLEEINSQIEKFKAGSPYSLLDNSAILGSGIFGLEEFDKNELLSFYDKAVKGGKFSKFVPASGAATRMFKDLLEFYHSDNSELNGSCIKTFSELENFPFYDDLKKVLSADGHNINDLIENKNYKLILGYILFEKGLNYSSLPKGLLKFSHYEDTNITALEEHFYEGLEYACNSENKIELHFTVSEEHLNNFETLVDKLKNKFLPDHIFDVTFSTQKPSTDTLAVDENNEPFRDKKNNIILRPGGHGALIHNLNSLDGDIVFIKNIDNVQRNGEDLGMYKKLLAGLLLKLQTKIFEYIEQLKNKELENISQIENFLINDLNIYLQGEYYKKSSVEKIKHLLSLLIRPIRVCGMVKNTGAPGGGPFYVRKSNDISLQIVESSQIDLSKDDQNNIFESSTHFNPVDIVCGLRDNDGDTFNLLNFVDPETYFISNKSVDGKSLKALELPGLWNGAMADWITVFVQVPLETFTPVKTVNDLL